MYLELIRMVYKAIDFDCLEDVAILLFREVGNHAFYYNAECSYKGVVIYVGQEEYAKCEWNKDKFIAFIKNKYSDSVGE